MKKTSFKSITKIMILLICLLFLLGRIGQLMVKQDSRYMLSSQIHQKAEDGMQGILSLMIPYANAFAKESEKEEENAQMVKKMLHYAFPTVEYITLYGNAGELALVNQEVPAEYLEDGGQEEDTNAVIQENVTEITTQSPATTEEVVETVKKKGKKGNTFSSVYTNKQLSKTSFLKSNIYAIDSMTPVYAKDINAKTLLSKDLTIDKSGEEPKVLIYHTHGSEAFADSRKNKTEDTVIGVGDVLAEELKNHYGINVYHDRNVYDVINGSLDRSQAYNVAGEALEQTLAQHPSIDVVIDLHRDGVAEGTRLVTTIDGKNCAQIMFFNGMSRIAGKGDIAYLKNDNLQDNLAFSLQLQLAAKEHYDNYTRKIFIRSYRYNLHYRGRSTLIEAGAQTNTVQEVKNAMYPLARILNDVLSKEGTQ